MGDQRCATDHHDGDRGAGRVIEHGTIVVRDRRIMHGGAGRQRADPRRRGTSMARLTVVPGLSTRTLMASRGFHCRPFACHAGVVAVNSGTLNSRFGLRGHDRWEATGRTSDDASLARIELRKPDACVRAMVPSVGRFNLLEAHGTPYTSL